MRITEVSAIPVSFPIPPANRVALGIGTAVKRDAVVVKITSDEGLVGWGEAHHGRAHTIVERLAAETAKAINESEIKGRFSEIGIIPVGNAPAQAAKFLDDEVAKRATVITKAGVKAEQ